MHTSTIANHRDTDFPYESFLIAPFAYPLYLGFYANSCNPYPCQLPELVTSS